MSDANRLEQRLRRVLHHASTGLPGGDVATAQAVFTDRRHQRQARRRSVLTASAVLVVTVLLLGAVLLRPHGGARPTRLVSAGTPHTTSSAVPPTTPVSGPSIPVTSVPTPPTTILIHPGLLPPPTVPVTVSPLPTTTTTTPGTTTTTAPGNSLCANAAGPPGMCLPHYLLAVRPDTGPNNGGTQVTITGDKLGDATGVTFGSTPAASMHVVSDQQIMAVTPVHDVGQVRVTVTFSDGQPAGAASGCCIFTFTAWTPIVNTVQPNAGPTSGATAVTIYGVGFTGATGVTFGSTPATSFTVVSDSEIRAVSPAHSAGTVDVLVANAHGTSTATSHDQFTYA